MKNFTLCRGHFFKLISVILLVFYSASLMAQNPSDSTGVILATEFHITRPLTEIFSEKENMLQPTSEDEEIEESEDREHRTPQRFPLARIGDPIYGNDPSQIQKEMGTVPGLPVKANWAGQVASGFRPYDPSGAIGPNHYIQMINSTTFKVYDKTLGTVLLTGTLGNLWSPATANAGDPIVMYDKAADRWFMAQFGSGNQVYIAVSQTNNPLGSWYTYTYISPQFPDYLKFAVWADAYYMTSNQSSQKVFAFNRAEILAGTPSARSVYATYAPPNDGAFFCPLAGDAADGVLPTYGTPCPILSMSDNGWGSGWTDAMMVYNMTVNWVPTTPTASISLAATLPTAAFDAYYDPSWNDIPQPGTAQMLDGIGGAPMYRAQWKSWSGYNTVLMNWAVRMSATRRSIKWCEVRQNTTTGIWSLYQEGIYEPDTLASRWMGSMAMDNNGNIGLSYMKSNSTSIFPSLYYTGRRPCDPLGTLPVAETVAIAGTGSQTGINRDGDYAQTTLDPSDGITFWSTCEYMGGSTGGSAARTRIFSFQIPPCGNAAAVNIAITSGANPSCTGQSITFTASPTNGGTTPVYQWQVNGANVGSNLPTYTSSTLVSGQVVTCIMTSNLVGVTANPATSNSITMTVSAPITVGTTATSTTICSGISTTITATGGTTYTWNPGTLTGTAITVAPTTTTTYTVTGVTGGCSNTATRIITVNALPTVGTTVTSSTICAGVSTSITGTGANTYTWNPGALSGTTVTVTPAATTTYTVTGTTTATGCTKTATRVITVNALPTVGTTVTSSTVCSGVSTSITGTGANTYTWNPGVLSGTTISVTPASTTTYTVTGTNTATTCTNTATRVITVNALPTVGTTVTSSTVCSGVSTSITGTGANTYTWNPGVLSGTTISVTPASTTTYTVTGTNTATTCTNTATRVITVNALPTVGTTVTSSTVCAGVSTSITGTGANTYAWNPGALSGTTISVTPASTTTYTVTGTSTATTCTNTATRVITVNACGSVLNLKCFIQGYYIGSNSMNASLLNEGVPGSTANVTDTIIVELRNTSSPFGIAASIKTILNTNGTAVCNFPIQGTFYITVKHRNGLQTWSANPITLNSVPLSYDFSTALSKAYGNNQTLVDPGVFAFFSGDLNADENIDLSDLSLLENDIILFAFGYKATDINGDGNIDILDSPIEESNINSFIFSIHP